MREAAGPVDTGDLLLAIVHEPGHPGARILTSLGVPAWKVRAALSEPMTQRALENRRRMLHQTALDRANEIRRRRAEALRRGRVARGPSFGGPGTAA